MLESLPSRPLRRSEVSGLDESNAIQAIFPVYDDRRTDLVFGLVLVLNGTAHAVSFSDGGWEVVEKRDVGESPEGVPWEAMEDVEELQDVAASEIDL